MRRWMRSWVSRLLVDTSIEVAKLQELTTEIRELNDERERKIADLNNTDEYWRFCCGKHERTEP